MDKFEKVTLEKIRVMWRMGLRKTRLVAEREFRKLLLTYR